MDKTQLLNEREDCIDKTLHNQKGDYIPVISIATTWMYYQIGKKPKDAFDDPSVTAQAMRHYYDHVYMDGILVARNGKTFAPEILDLLDGGTYTYDKDGMQQTCPGSVEVMGEDEYDALIENPYGFILEKIFPRRYGIMRRTDADKYADMKRIIESLQSSLQLNAAEDRIAEDDYGIKQMRMNAIFNPLDIILDYLRDFVPISKDVRRRPDQLRDAGLALVDFVLDNVCTAQPAKGKVIFMPMHLPQFLRPKDFEKIYWPSYKKVVDYLIDHQLTPLFYFERKYEHLFDYFKEFPKNSVAGMYEDDDLRIVNQKLGDHMAMAGGMPTELLQNGTKEQCVDYAKKLIDDISPNGGFLFTTDKIMLSEADGKIDNLAAVNEFVHHYGVYR